MKLKLIIKIPDRYKRISHLAIRLDIENWNERYRGRYTRYLKNGKHIYSVSCPAMDCDSLWIWGYSKEFDKTVFNCSVRSFIKFLS